MANPRAFIAFDYDHDGFQKNGEGGSFQSAAECLAKHWTHFVEKGKP